VLGRLRRRPYQRRVRRHPPAWLGWRPMVKKLIFLLILVALGAVAARKLRAS
jgi:hypothetical protein